MADRDAHPTLRVCDDVRCRVVLDYWTLSIGIGKHGVTLGVTLIPHRTLPTLATRAER